MFPSAGDELTVKPSGVLIAVIAFVLTRGFLVDAAYGSGGTVTLFTGLVPLVLGLLTVIVGVDLAVSTHDSAYARTVATWVLLGGLGMAMVVGIGVLAPGQSLVGTLTNRAVTSAAAAGGIGGVVVGVQNARNSRQSRDLAQHADQTVLLNRLLRHEVLNALTAIQGNAELLADGDADGASVAAILDSAGRIERTVEDVGFLVRTGDERAAALGSIDLRTVLRRIQQDRPAVAVGAVPSVHVRADDRLETGVTTLVDRASSGADADEVTVSVEVRKTEVAIEVAATGSWLRQSELEVLTRGLPEFDTPEVDYDISVVRLLSTQYGGRISVEEGGQTAVTVALPRTGEEARPAASPGVDTDALLTATAAGLLAGLAMGVILQTLSGELAVIGALYGVRTPVLGWLAHLFHSVVFSTLYVAIRSHTVVAEVTDTVPAAVGLAIGYAGFLWLGAAGILMPLWLNAVGISTPVPNLVAASLVGHLVWGTVVGIAVVLLSGPHSADPTRWLPH